MNILNLQSHSLRNSPYGQALTEIMAAALQAVDPEQAVLRHIDTDAETITIGSHSYQNIQRVIVIGAGKAGTPMLQAAVNKLGDRIRSGLVVVKEGHLGSGNGGQGSGGRQQHLSRSEATASSSQTQNSSVQTQRLASLPKTQNLQLIEAAHPVPDQRSIQASQQISALLQNLTEHDLVLVLLSGGGSALLTWPAPGLALDDLRNLTTHLLACGATIGEINALRKHCTRLFGGRLARLASPAQVASLIVSDVIGSPLDVIASGPSSPDPTTYADAWHVIERYQLQSKLSPALLEHLQRGLAGQLEETVKPEEPLWERVHNTIIASNVLAAEAAMQTARKHGFQAEILSTYLEGEAREVGRVAAAIARERVIRGDGQPRLLIAGGETTVTLRGQGLGGRNQELALGAVEGLRGLKHACIIALASDGGDGPTVAAGAVVTGESWERAQTLGLNLADYLCHNDAYHFFEALDDLLRPGPTLTNVNDLLFVFTYS